MQQYEIRILRSDGQTALIATTTYFSDFAAIRAAKKLARDKGIEVWRGMDLVYDTPQSGGRDCDSDRPSI